MNISNRTCATCANYEPASEGEAPMCQMGVYLLLHEGTPQEEVRTTFPDDTCDDHITPEEEATEALEFKLGGLSLECLKAIQAYGSLSASLGEEHPDTMAAWTRAETLDDSGYLANLMRDLKAGRHKAYPTAGASPEFTEAMTKARHLKETLGIESPEASAALMRAMDLAPEGLIDEACDLAIQMGLLPAIPDGYTEDGQAVYSLEGFAQRMGISLEEAEQAATEMAASRAAQGLPTEIIAPNTPIYIPH